MAVRRRTKFEGIGERATRELVGLQDELAADNRALRDEVVGVTTDDKVSGTYGVRFSERIRCLPAAAGLDLVFPTADAVTQNRWIEVLHQNANPVRIRAIKGNVQGVPLLTLTTAGLYYFSSDGKSSWWSAPIGSGGSPGILGIDATENGGPVIGNFQTLDVDDSAKVTVGTSFGGGILNLVWGIVSGSLSLTDLANIAANTFLGNPTAGSAVVQAVAVAAESIVARTSGNLGQLTSSAQSALIRAAGSLFFATASADQALQRLGSADLGFSATCRLLRAPQIISATNAAFAHPTGTRFIIVEGVGGGGASGGAGAVAGGVGSGGNSGTWGRRTFTSISGTSNVVVGAGGTAGAAGAAGNTGGSSSWTHNGSTTTLPGGVGGTVLAGAASIATAAINAANAAATSADVSFPGAIGQPGYRTAGAAAPTWSGDGGSCPFGTGGRGVLAAAGVTQAGRSGNGFGSGASGRSNGSSAVAQAGTAGNSGLWICWEFS